MSGQKVGEDNYWVKDYLCEYVNMFREVSSLLQENIPHNIYTVNPFKGCTFSDMLELYNQHLLFTEDPQTGLDADRKKAFTAFKSIKYWLDKDPSEIRSWALKQFREYIMEHTADKFEPWGPSLTGAVFNPVPAKPNPVPVVPADTNVDHVKPSSDQPSEPDFEHWEDDWQGEILRSMDEGNHVYSSFCTV